MSDFIIYFRILTTKILMDISGYTENIQAYLAYLFMNNTDAFLSALSSLLSIPASLLLPSPLAQTHIPLTKAQHFMLTEYDRTCFGYKLLIMCSKGLHENSPLLQMTSMQEEQTHRRHLCILPIFLLLSHGTWNKYSNINPLPDNF